MSYILHYLEYVYVLCLAIIVPHCGFWDSTLSLLSSRQSLYLYRFWHWAALPKIAGTLSATPWSSRVLPKEPERVSFWSGCLPASSWFRKPLWWNAAVCSPSSPTKPACSPSVMSSGQVRYPLLLKHLLSRHGEAIYHFRQAIYFCSVNAERL